MRSIEDKEISSSSGINFDFHKGNALSRTPQHHHHHRTPLGKPTPSKWDDAQKWLVNLSRAGGGGGGEKKESSNKPRNSNADDLRLIAPVPKKEDYSSGEEEEKVECNESVWRINKPVTSAAVSAVRSVCVRDMGTEMTPIASQEPSRTATPIRATTPAARSPMSSGSSTPVRFQKGVQSVQTREFTVNSEEPVVDNLTDKKSSNQDAKMNPMETRAMAWDEAERAKYMARYKREEVKIQAWENHEKRKAEMELRRMEVKAERLKARAQEKFTNKLAATRRIAEEKRANAEAKLNEKAVKTSETSDYIRRTGHLPSSFSFKLPSFCW